LTAVTPPHVPHLILGAGPTGLGAAWRLNELGRDDWLLLEAADHAGGLASSFVDDHGFTWDVGGHVQFSHYAYFDAVMDALLGADGWLEHPRASWIRLRDRFIPYPFQNNLHRLPEPERARCLAGLEEVARRSATAAPENFRDWIHATMGAGIAEVFMLPYNFKVWAWPPEMLGTGWMGDRVAPPDLARVREAIAAQRDDVSWGPNKTFRFPRRGGTGAVWRACAGRLPAERVRFGHAVTAIDLGARRVTTHAGGTFTYDRLITTLPLDQLLRRAGEERFAPLVAAGLLYSSSNIVGLGLRGWPSDELAAKSWIYFPEENCPFYRATIFSNYSPHNVPDPARFWSLMCEISESPRKPVRPEALVEETVAGALATGLIGRREEIVSTWTYRAPHGYPTPALGRDRALGEILPFLEARGVYSRGRFGLWKYEVSNQDHAFMQGVELVERLVSGRAEMTAFDPNFANSRKHAWVGE
jgi:protoporphyrinogen oxidase